MIRTVPGYQGDPANVQPDDNADVLSNRLQQIRQTQSMRRGSVSGLNASLLPGKAPLSGYTGERDYLQGLNENGEAADIESRLSGKGGVRVNASYAGTRPSMGALRGAGAGNAWGSLGYEYDPATDPNNRSFAPTFEQSRQAHLIGDMDSRAEGGIRREQAVNDAQFDLGSGRAAARERMVGDIGRDEELSNARNKAKIFFDPDVQKQREGEFYNRMEELRRRYSDPAIVKAQQEIDAARIRAQGGIDRENVRGGYGVQEHNIDAGSRGDNTDVNARARIGAAVAQAGGQNAADYAPPAPPGRGQSGRALPQGFDMKGFAEANTQGDIEAAKQLARRYGYQVP